MVDKSVDGGAMVLVTSTDGKLKSIAENRLGVEVNLQQGEDHRPLRFRGQSLSNFRLLAWR